MCGEKPFVTGRSTVLMGSPPRMRGKGCCHHPVIFVDRITPAYAGKRASASPAPSVPWDHPRVYGEKLARLYSSVPVPGSPPRVRGKVLCGVDGLHCVGITPACAGKSNERWQFRTSRRDHPRVCGEKLPGCAVTLAGTGSPPRMRGKAGPEGQHHQPAGITPACAGKSMGALIADAAERDHPRVCGEKKSTIHSYLNSTGSPPRVRGKGLSYH